LQACLCGFTSQYKQLEELQQKYAEQGFTVIAFPCNQFGKQEPWDHEKIVQFTEDKFKVT
jgi:glutathione peroxidase